MLVHICCSVDSHFFIQQIQKEYTKEQIECFFYDPNIHPYSEYALRLLDVKYSCKKLGVNLIEGPYDLDKWLEKVKGLENEPEKGNRCTVCYDDRLETTILKAKELNHKSFTTTLLISPKKSQEKLNIIGNNLSSIHGPKFIYKDYKSGLKEDLIGQSVKKNSLYRQNYCGCMFALNTQRKNQNKICDELFSPINKQIMPESIEYRLQIYQKRNEFEEKNIKYKIIKKRFLNYRLLSASVSIKKETIPSYFFCYSTLNNKKSNGKIEYIKNNIHYLNRDSVKILNINTFNHLAKTKYLNVNELSKNPLEFDCELALKQKITNSTFDISTIIVLDTIPDSKLLIWCNSKIYQDEMETII